MLACAGYDHDLWKNLRSKVSFDPSRFGEGLRGIDLGYAFLSSPVGEVDSSVGSDE